jgi:hypothetical protein
MPHLGAAGRPGQAYVPIILETSNQKLKMAPGRRLRL